MVYLLITMSYHWADFLHHLYSVKRNDFFEMACHHLVTLYLVLGSYMMNHWKYATIIIYNNHIADITSAICRLLTQSTSKYMLLAVFLLNLLLWIHTRIYSLGMIIWNIVDSMQQNKMGGFQGENLVVYYFVWLLSILEGLQIFWFYMFISLFMKFIK